MKRRLLALPLLLTLGVALTACNPVGTLNRATSLSGLSVTHDLHYGSDPRNVLDIYAPQGAANKAVVLFIHGGSWDSGSKDEYVFVGESLARAGYVTAVMNYRLAPQHPYPDYVIDAASALKWLQDNAAQYGGNGQRLYVVGHSAGAFNAVDVVDDSPFLSDAGVQAGTVRGVVGIAGPYDYDFRQFPTKTAFPAGGDPAQIMPTQHIRADAPPNLLLVAGNDQTVDPSNGEKMKAALQAAGVPYTYTVLPGLSHITVVAALSRRLTFLGGTRQAVLDFLNTQEASAANK
ncbi:alpha/beta hydrolase [Deinococcus psychrotolerans]|uniref:Alpha/beta hydrolase n=1 Tax=Deinococcus psychrotolerans TaxID=2489213 RepID=A0A3G8YA30_9DEIO|nr:alpha/beta hydrolase [Deinococcus psychrotolerans]AZI42228.1 alpha/beta hydrolase [Deinococcus psychrotolerans]